MPGRCGTPLVCADGRRLQFGEAFLACARILIVEDDPLSGRTLAAILRHFGHTVELVTSVTAGLEHLARDVGGCEPQCVLLDLMLPDGDGALILARLRAARGARPPARVAVITSSALDDARIEVLRRLGADRVFAKPVDVQQLLAWIDAATANPSDQPVRPTDDLPGLRLQ